MPEAGVETANNSHHPRASITIGVERKETEVAFVPQLRLIDQRRSQQWPPLFRVELSLHLGGQNDSVPSEDTPADRDISFDRAGKLRHWLFGINERPRNILSPRN